MAQAPEPAESKSNDSNLDAVDMKFWRSLEKSHKQTFSEILSILKSTDTAAGLTVGIFHDPNQKVKSGNSKGGIFGWLSSTGNDKNFNTNAMTRDALTDFTIFPEKQISVKLRAHWIHESTQYSHAIDRSVGCMVGMGIADAVGHPLEFVDVSNLKNDKKSLPRFDYQSNRYFNEFNRFSLERGQWTDDASMGLCMADSLLLKGQYDGRYVTVCAHCGDVQNVNLLIARNSIVFLRITCTANHYIFCIGYNYGTYHFVDIVTTYHVMAP